MHFTKVSLALLGLAAFTSAVPHQLEAGNVERGLTWTPRALRERKNEDNGKGKNNKDITIIDTTIVKLSEQSRNSEVELVVIVEEKIRRESEEKKAKDNVRKNHFRNKNRDVNTVIIVITEIIDIRDSNNQNKRYMRHQLRADNKQRDDVTIQVTEIVAITVSENDRGSDSKGKGKESRTTANAEDNSGQSGATAASDAAAAAIQTVDPNAPYASTNQTMLLPSGAPPPSAAQLDSDPAAMVEDGYTGGYVQSVGS